MIGIANDEQVEMNAVPQGVQIVIQCRGIALFQ